MEPSSPFLYKSIKIDKMGVIKTDIEGVLIIEPHLFRDARGYFFESFSEREFKEKVEPLVGYKVEFCQDNESMSSYGVMRGLHFQRPPFTQSKLEKFKKCLLKLNHMLKIEYKVNNIQRQKNDSIEYK